MMPPQLLDCQQLWWHQLLGLEIEQLLQSGAVAFLDAHWMVAFWEQGGRTLARRQDLPDEAFITLEDLKAAGTPENYLPCIMQSYMWLQPDRPDPLGFTLRQMVSVLKAFTAMRPEQYGNSTASSVGPGHTQRWGVFVDFNCLHQKPRTESEELLFNEALESLDKLYSHPHTIVIRFTKLPDDYPRGYNIPPDANVAEYANRGWTFTESWWSCIIKDRWGSWDAAMLSGSERTLEQVRRPCTEGVRLVALTPDQFDAQVRTKRFTNGKEDQPLCARLYSLAFEQRFGSTSVIKLNSMAMDDTQAIQLAAILRTNGCANLEAISLHSNQISSRGIAALTKAISTVTMSRLKKLLLGCNPFGDEGAIAISSMIMAGATPRLEELDVRTALVGSGGMQALTEAVVSRDARFLRTVVAKNNVADDGPLQRMISAKALPLACIP